MLNSPSDAFWPGSRDCPAAGSESGCSVRLLGRGESRRWTRELLGKESNAIRGGPGRGLARRGRGGPSGSGRSRRSGGARRSTQWGRVPGGAAHALPREDGAADLTLPSLSPKKKNKVGERRREQPPSFPPLASADRLGPRRQGEGAGPGWPIESTGPGLGRPRGRAAGPLPACPLPRGPAGRPREAALGSPRSSGLSAAARAPAAGVGAGRGFPAGESSPGAGGGGRGRDRGLED